MTAEDEAAWETKLDLKRSIEAWKKRFHVILDAYTGGSAGLTVTQCGASRACDAWLASPLPCRRLVARRQLDSHAIKGDESQVGGCR